PFVSQRLWGEYALQDMRTHPTTSKSRRIRDGGGATARVALRAPAARASPARHDVDPLAVQCAVEDRIAEQPQFPGTFAGAGPGEPAGGRPGRRMHDQLRSPGR